MTAQLDAALPGSRVQNNDDGFLRWLSEKDQFAGTSRQQLLTQAWQSRAVDHVIVIFKGYTGARTQHRSDRYPGRQRGASHPSGKPWIMA
jgi:hypothetical protein